MPHLVGTEANWGSRQKYLTVLLCQLIGTPMFTALPNAAMTHGTVGYMLGYLLSYFIFGVPLLYMEFIISQFTARDCIDAWKVRPCLSHIGYILLVWQVLIIINNHVTVSFTLHYFLISFENPIPYYTCGYWSTTNCNILIHNFTVNEDCIRTKNPPAYCDSLHTTFPEYQHWKYNMLGVNKSLSNHFAWPVCLASAIVTGLTYINNLKRKNSIKFIVSFYTYYPICGYLLLLMGSMLQKGVVVVYESALDSDFSVFFKKFRLTLIIMQVVNNLGIGSGFSFNLAASTAFRSPCYSNTVIAVVACAAVSVLSVCTTAMITCPYSYEHSIDPYRIINSNMALIYEKIPRMLYEYQGKYFWLILIFSSQVVVGLSTNVILIHHLLEMLTSRYSRFAKYQGLTAMVIIVLIYFISIPLLGHIGMASMLAVRRFSVFVSTFIAILETIVFVVWYGLDRFSEDVHFMQGIQPTRVMKIAWLYSGAVLCYVLCYEINIKVEDYNGTLTDKLGWWVSSMTLLLVVGLFLIKLIFAACKRKLCNVLGLDSSWGPRNGILQRSRAMFTAQAMTKEYLYRQYHLQAGMLQRQRTSNCRIERTS